MFVNSQNDIQKEQTQITIEQRFYDLDTDKDGYISKAEFNFDSFEKYDLDQDGNLTRNEFREMKHSIFEDQCKARQGKANAHQKRQGNKGDCPYGNQTGKNKNCPKQKRPGNG